jgi:hypothetical protein
LNVIRTNVKVSESMNRSKKLTNASVVLSAELAKVILGKVRRLSPDSVQALDNELIRARIKFPGNAHLNVALAEEVGELARAYLEGDLEGVKAEALQVACVAIRILEEGDSDFGDSR